ncbi:MAG: efflux RND transporter permease subunit [Bacteroidota bacterium]
MEYPGTRQPSKASFPTLILFFSLTCWGLFLVPQLPLSLYPTYVLPTYQISFIWSSAPPEIIERQVTSLCEGYLARMEGLSQLTSSSYQGSAVVNARFERGTDPDFKLNEIRALMRILSAQLPEEVSYPQVRFVDDDPERDAFMILSLNGEGAKGDVSYLAEQVIMPQMAQIKGMGDINISQRTNIEWALSYDTERLQQFGISATALADQLRQYFQTAHVTPQIAVRSPFAEGQLPYVLKKLPIQGDSSTVSLDHLVTFDYQPVDPQSYFRLNGEKATSIFLYAEPGVNHLALAERIYAQLESLQAAVGEGVQLDIAKDNTLFIRDELEKMWQRGLAVLGLLLLFVLLISRSFAYLGTVILALTCNLGIGALLYYIFHVEVNLYSLAAITVSFGIMIDNVLVMLQHLRLRGDHKVIRSLVAATLTTLVPILLLSMSEGSQTASFRDFVWAIVINLSLSLVIAKWLLPELRALLLAGRPTRRQHTFKRKRRIVKWLRRYMRLIGYLQRRRWLLVTAFIFAFGLPTFLLPEEIELAQNAKDRLLDPPSRTAELLADFYNQTLGDTYIAKEIRPPVEKWLGGTFRLFVEETFLNGSFSEPRRQKLMVNVTAPQGTTPAQLNAMMQRVEAYLVQFGAGIDFQVKIYNSQQAQIQVVFPPAVEKTYFPASLQNALTLLAIETGGVDWDVWGIIQGFSNATNVGAKTSRIAVYGYNYEQLKAEAERLKQRLLSDRRVEEVFLNGRMRFDYRPLTQVNITLNPEIMAIQGLTQEEVYAQIREKTVDQHILFQGDIGGESMQVALRNRAEQQWDLWRIQNTHITMRDGTLIKLSELGKVTESPPDPVIDKKNQQYQILLEFDYLGPKKMEQRFAQKMVDIANKELPIGFVAEAENGFGFQKGALSEMQLIILLAFVLIYAVITIALESLRQAFAVIWMIPVSFVGVFTLFYLGHFLFDQGGYAGFLLLSGITVNAGLYIVQAYQEAKKQQPGRTDLVLYMKGFAERVAPVFFTILSTILGFLPFVFFGEEVFWYSLAWVCIGGLLFSLIGILVYLPVFLCKKD